MLYLSLEVLTISCESFMPTKLSSLKIVNILLVVRETKELRLRFIALSPEWRAGRLAPSPSTTSTIGEGGIQMLGSF